MQVEIYVQARMGSTRLPGKVMRLVQERPLLDYLLERLGQVKEADAIAVLTTIHPNDDEIVEFCEKKKIPCYRGPEEDVLARFYKTALQRKPDAIVRITADCPLIDPDIVDLVIKTYREWYPIYDYISNTLQSTYPRGLDTEIFSLQALDHAFNNAQKPEEREHVTVYMYQHPQIFNLLNISSPLSLGHHRWTVDTIEDFTLIRLILTHLYPYNPNFRLKDILELLRQNPDWEKINAHVKQKVLPPEESMTPP